MQNQVENTEFVKVDKKPRQGPRGQRLQKRVEQERDSKPQREGPSYRDLVFKLNNLENRIHSPKVDLVENGDTYFVKMELPGVDTEHFSVKLKDSQFLLVTGTKEEAHTEETQDSHGHKIVYKESKYGSITRRVKLPSTITKFTTTLSNGVLEIVCNKQDTTFKYIKKEPRQESRQEQKPTQNRRQIQVKQEPVRQEQSNDWSEM
jgi:HSP20 family molecular chaperone IbpA